MHPWHACSVLKRFVLIATHWHAMNDCVRRLQDVVFSRNLLYLVFDYMDLDLKKYMESVDPVGMPPELIKVSIPCPFVVCADIAAKFLRTTPPVAELHVPNTCRHRLLPRAPRPAP